MNDNFGNVADKGDVLVETDLSGVVIKYMSEKGFGFIKMNNTQIKSDIFVYHNQIKNIDKSKEFIKLQIGQDVKFDLYSTKRGYVAKNVHVQGMNQLAAVNIFKGSNSND